MTKTITLLLITILSITGVQAALVFRYDFNNSAPTTDGGPNNYTPVVTGAVQYGDGTYWFDGSDDYIRAVPSSTLNMFNKSKTILVKFRLNQTSACTNGANIVVQGWDNRLYVRTACQVSGIFQNATGADTALQSYDKIALSNSMSDLGWYHVALVYDNTSNKSTMWVQGLNTSTVTTPGTDSDTSQWDIGGRGSGSLYFKGWIDYVAVYDHAMTEAEILTDMDSTQETNEPYTLNLNNPLNPRIDVFGATTHGNFVHNITVVYNATSGTTAANYTDHQALMQASGVRYLRTDFYLESATTTSGAFNNNATVVNRSRATVDYCWNNGNPICIVGMVTAYTPTKYADNATDCSSDRTRCAPTNGTTLFNNIIYPYIMNITNNCERASIIRMEIWNEPDLSGFWLPEAGSRSTNTTIITKFISQLHNPIYDGLQTTCSDTIPIVAPGFSSVKTANGYFFANQYYNNTSISGKKVDRANDHMYWNDGGGKFYDYLINNRYSVTRGILNNYSYGNIPIDVTETNIAGGDTQINKTKMSEALVGHVIARWMTNNPNETLALYQWSDTRDYAEGDGVFPEWPSRFNFIEDTWQGGEKFFAYNASRNIMGGITKGSIIWNVSETSFNNISPIVFVKAGNNTWWLGGANLQASALINVTFSGYNAQNVLLNNGSTYNFNNGRALIPAKTYSTYGGRINFDTSCITGKLAVSTTHVTAYENNSCIADYLCTRTGCS